MDRRVADVTVIILAYSTERWDLTCASVESVLDQTVRPREIIMCIDDNPELAERFTERWRARAESAPAVRVVESRHEERSTTVGDEEEWRSYASHGRRISSGRTTGLELAGTEILAFLDDDATAEPDWLERLLEPYADPSVVAVGGAPLPVYAKPRPRWFPSEFDWVFGCAYTGLPTHTAPALRLIGANMSARRKSLLAIGGFRSMAEDLDMCHRLLELSPQTKLIYEPGAVVWHHVHDERLTWQYFWRRCFWASRSKVAIMRGLGGAANLRADRDFVLRTLSLGVLRGLREFLSGDVGGLERSLSIIAGLGLSGVAYLVGVAEWNIAAWRGRENAPAH
jgi:GT2 family glycosyltransferase